MYETSVHLSPKFKSVHYDIFLKTINNFVSFVLIPRWRYFNIYETFSNFEIRLAKNTTTFSLKPEKRHSNRNPIVV